MISITAIMIQTQAVRMSLFLSAFSSWGYKERDTNRKSLWKPYYTDPTTHTWRFLWCLRSQLISASQDPDWSALIRSEKFNYAFQWSNPNYLSFYNPHILRTISSGYDVIHPLNSPQQPSSPISCLRVYYIRWWLSYPFHTSIRVHHLSMAPGLRDTSKPYQTK